MLQCASFKIINDAIATQNNDVISKQNNDVITDNNQSFQRILYCFENIHDNCSGDARKK